MAFQVSVGHRRLWASPKVLRNSTMRGRRCLRPSLARDFNKGGGLLLLCQLKKKEGGGGKGDN